MKLERIIIQKQNLFKARCMVLRGILELLKKIWLQDITPHGKVIMKFRELILI